jgi:hypothetical protein
MRVLPVASLNVTGSPDLHTAACPLHGAAVLLLALFTAVVIRRVLLCVLPGARRWMRTCKASRRLPPPLPSVHIDGVRPTTPSWTPAGETPLDASVRLGHHEVAKVLRHFKSPARARGKARRGAQPTTREDTPEARAAAERMAALLMEEEEEEEEEEEAKAAGTPTRFGPVSAGGQLLCP